MKRRQSSSADSPDAPEGDDRALKGAAIIEAGGKERPITEAMIRRALDDLDRAWCRQQAERARRSR